jgi:hypothetical protein
LEESVVIETMATKYLEELIYKFLSNTLNDEEKRTLTNGYEAEKHIDEESEEEMRQEVWNYVFRNVVWASIITRLREEAEPEDEEEDCESTSSEEYE